MDDVAEKLRIPSRLLVTDGGEGVARVRREGLAQELGDGLARQRGRSNRGGQGVGDDVGEHGRILCRLAGTEADDYRDAEPVHAR